MPLQGNEVNKAGEALAIVFPELIRWSAFKDLFKNRKFGNAEARVRFFAAAYTYGFLRPQLEIEQWQSKIAFPYGVKYKGAQVVYADLAVEFFEKYINEF